VPAGIEPGSLPTRKLALVLSGPSRAFGVSPTSEISTTSGISATLLLAVLATLLALFTAVLPCFSMLLALLPALLAVLAALLALFPAILVVSWPFLIPATTTALTGTIALASGSVSTFAMPAPTSPTGFVASVSPPHALLLVLSIA
jgi:hypothetical protein